MQQPGEARHLAWSDIEDGVTWATVGPPGRGRIRLMVESLPDEVWEWTAWRANRPGEFRHGCFASQAAACAAAEHAARDMEAADSLALVRLDRYAAPRLFAHRQGA